MPNAKLLSTQVMDENSFEIRLRVTLKPLRLTYISIRGERPVAGVAEKVSKHYSKNHQHSSQVVRFW